jgi:hypothetical protein
VSDYFTRLAEQALGVAPAPRPVVPSRFERVAAPSPPTLELEADRETGAAPPPTTSPQPAATGSPPPIAAGPAPGRAEPATVGQAAADAAHDQRPRPATEPTDRSSAVTTRRRRTTVTDDHRLDDEGPPRRGHGVVPWATDRDPLPTLVGATPQVDRSPTEERPLVAAPATAPAPSPSPSVAPRREPAAPPEPTVHVTIGRVDVRAVPPSPASPPTARPHAPGGRRERTSLEAYLRGGGSGR